MRKPLDAANNVVPRQMARLLALLALVAGLLAGSAGLAQAATTPLFINQSDVNNPPIDATAVVNLGTINSTNSGLLFNAILFQTQNTLNLTNTISGVFSGDLGFDFGFTTNTSRLFSDYFVNQGIIRGDNIQIAATNVLNSGDLLAGELLQMQGNNVNLTRSVLTATLNNSLTTTTTGFRSVDTNGVVTYQNPSAVADIYWGAGTGNVMTASAGFGSGLFLQSLDSLVLSSKQRHGTQSLPSIVISMRM